MTKRRTKTAAGEVLKQLADAGDKTTLSVDGHDLPVTSLDKPLWPGAGRRPGATKRDLLSYLARVAPFLLPHLADRPLFVTRFPTATTSSARTSPLCSGSARWPGSSCMAGSRA